MHISASNDTSLSVDICPCNAGQAARKKIERNDFTLAKFHSNQIFDFYVATHFSATDNRTVYYNLVFMGS